MGNWWHFGNRLQVKSHTFGWNLSLDQSQSFKLYKLFWWVKYRPPPPPRFPQTAKLMTLINIFHNNSSGWWEMVVVKKIFHMKLIPKEFQDLWVSRKYETSETLKSNEPFKCVFDERYFVIAGSYLSNWDIRWMQLLCSKRQIKHKLNSKFDKKSQIVYLCCSCWFGATPSAKHIAIRWFRFCIK